MPDLPKRELDELFREGAGMQTFEYNETAWNKMEVMLDSDDKNRKIGMWLLLLIGVAIAVMAGLYYSSLSDTSTPQDVIYASENDSVEPSSTNSQVAQPELVIEESTTATIAQENVTIAPAKAAIVIEGSNVKAIEAVNNNFASVTTATNEIVNTGNNDLATNNTQVETENVSANQSSEIAKNISSSIPVLVPENTEFEAVTKSLIEIAAIQNIKLAALSSLNLGLANHQSILDVEEAIYDEKEDDSSIASRLSYTVFAAPEWSSVGIGGPREMGYKFGAKIGFQLSDRFELGTGLSISQKKFNGKGSQFTEAGGWIDDIMPMTMEAKCNVIEIPLDLNYHFNGVGNTGLVAGVGLRSFMLHSEWYGFEYNQSQYKPGLLEEKVMDNQNKNWVGSIELSLGYSKKVSNNLSVQIVPYLQIPVTGIGEGKVDLYSGGVQFAARFDSK